TTLTDKYKAKLDNIAKKYKMALRAKTFHVYLPGTLRINKRNIRDAPGPHEITWRMEKAYAPYSQFKVGASVLLSSGEVIQGSNQENIAFPSGLCAERVALFYAGANFPNEEVDVIVIVARGELMPDKQLLSPCGSCRQVMLETENRQSKPMKVILVNQDERTMIINSVQHLLPFGFGTFD
ncbi:MAG: cytidine deaminase, partial [Crocinitomicaceae bacterium]|nr:cytidine deaminase [Crocinitomicaceae bacterium]